MYLSAHHSEGGDTSHMIYIYITWLYHVKLIQPRDRSLHTAPTMARAKHHVQDFITYRSDHMPGIMKQPSSFPEGERLQTSPSPVLRKETTGPDNPFPYSSPTTSKNDVSAPPHLPLGVLLREADDGALAP